MRRAPTPHLPEPLLRSEHPVMAHSHWPSPLAILLLCAACGSGRLLVAATLSPDATCASQPSILLSNGVRLPAVGFGTAGLGRGTARSAQTALIQGFRHFDSAQATEWYDESSLGAVVQAAAVPREALFLSSKLHPKDHGAAAPLGPSLRAFGTSYLDLFMLHFPRCWDGVEQCRGATPAGTWRDSWRLLEAAYDAGEVRALGVSNFGLRDLEELWAMARVKPHVVQNWMDPLHPDRAVRAFCRDHGVAFVAYSSLGTQHLGRGEGRNPVLESPVLREIAARRGRSVAAVVLSWVLSGGAGVIPRSASAAHIEDNGAVLRPNGTVELSAAELAAIDGMARE